MWDLYLSDRDLDFLHTDLPSEHFVCLQDILKTSWRHALKTSVFSVTIFMFQDVFKKSLQDVFKTSSRSLGIQKIVRLKTFWKCFQDMSWRRLQDVFKTRKCFLGLYYRSKGSILRAKNSKVLLCEERNFWHRNPYKI